MPKGFFNKLGVIAFIVLAGVCLYFFVSNIILKQSLERIKQDSDAELQAVLRRERKSILRDVEEKHRADMVSFQAMAKRMEIEKERNRQLQEKLAKDATHPKVENP